MEEEEEEEGPTAVPTIPPSAACGGGVGGTSAGVQESAAKTSMEAGLYDAPPNKKTGQLASAAGKPLVTRTTSLSLPLPNRPPDRWSNQPVPRSASVDSASYSPVSTSRRGRASNDVAALSGSNRPIERRVQSLHPRPSLERAKSTPLTDEGGHYVKPAGMPGGLYLARFAVNVMASFLGINLLIKFAEVLLPFAFAVLLTNILEPLKRRTQRVLVWLAISVFEKVFPDALEKKPGLSRQSSRSEELQASGLRMDSIESEAGHLYGTIPEDSDREVNSDLEVLNRNKSMPPQWMNKIILVVSILFCVVSTGRLLFLAAKVFIKAVKMISADQEYYKRGADRIMFWIQMRLRHLQIKGVDWTSLFDDAAVYMEELGTELTTDIFNAVFQAVVTLIFLLYMLWSPVKMESNSTTQEAFTSTGRYLKMKCATSAATGVLVGTTLWACGLDYPKAFGFFAFLANFLPGIGSIVSSTLPCMLGTVDIRKSNAQVVAALLVQVGVHLLIDFFIEPIFFGISVEMHSVVVMLGIWFFYRIWGVAGMLLSVPLLAVIRLLLKAMKRASAGEATDTIAFWDNVLEGRWMTSVSDDGAAETELAIDPRSRDDSAPEDEADPWGELGDSPPRPRDGRRHTSKSHWEMLSESSWYRAMQEFNSAHKLALDCASLICILVFLVVLDA